jgi:DnaJ-class molecular chaperone
MECDWCAGYGSSLKEDGDRCSRCDGSGLVPLSWAERTTHSHGTRTAPSELLEDLAP